MTRKSLLSTTNQTKNNQRKSLIPLRLPLLVALIFVMLMAVYWIQLLSSYERLRQDARQETTRIAQQSARIVSVKIDNFLQKIDYTTTQLGHVWLNQPWPTFQDTVGVAVHSFPSNVLYQINLFDAQGYSLYNQSIHSNTLLDLPAIDWVKQQEPAASGRVQIGTPFQRTDNESWLIPFFKTIELADRPAVVVSVTVSSDYLSSILQDIFGDGKNVAFILKRDATYLARSQRHEQTVGRKLLDPSRFQFNNGSEQGSFEGVSKLDDTDRLYYWAHVPSYPLVASVGMNMQFATQSVEQVIKDSQSQNIVTTLMLLAMGVILLILTVLRARKSSEVLAIREQLSKLVAEIPGAVYQYQLNADHSSYFPYVSQGIWKLYGIQENASECDARTIFDRVHPDDRRDVWASILESARTLQDWRHEFRVIRVDQKVRWVLARANTERGSNGETLWHGYLHDSTYEREVQDALTAQSVKLELALDSVQDGIWEYNHKTRQIQCDERIRAMLGYDQHYSQFDAKRILRIIHPQDLSRVLRETAQSFLNQHDELMDVSFRLRTTTDSWLWTQARGRVIERDMHGKPVRSMGLLHDVSERVAETQLHEALLNRSVASITLVNSERKLIYANYQFRSTFIPEGTDIKAFDLRLSHIDEEHWNIFGEKYSLIQQQGQIRFEFPLKDRYGEIRWLDVQGVQKEPGNPHSDIIWTWFDVSNRHSIDQALSLERLRFHTLLQHFPGGVLIVDTENTSVFINEKATELLDVELSAHDRENLDPSALEDVLGEQILNWLERAQLNANQSGLSSIEVLTSKGHYLEIEYLDIQDGEKKLGSVWLVRDVSKRTREALKLHELATTDSLTKLPNRRAFMQVTDTLVRENQNVSGSVGALVMLDIDYFKQLNDTYGHTVGDQVLIHTAQVIRSSLREEDFPARIGGEEFAILLPGLNLETATIVANRVRERIATDPFELHGQPVYITTSVGLCPIDPDDMSETIFRADRALYAAKAQGRNLTVVWRAETHR